MPEDILRLPPPAPDQRIAYGSGPNHFLELRFPASKRETSAPLVINIHGGFWRAKYDLAHAGHLCAALQASGIATANVEYRRVGNDGGGWPGSLADICSAYQFLLQNTATYGIDPNRFVVMGHSAGGQLALCLAAREPALKAVISLAGVIDLRRAYDLHLSNDAVVEFLHGTPGEVPESYREADPRQLSIKPQQWLIHGQGDDTVPAAFSRDYVAAKRNGLRKEDAHLIEIPGAGHMDLIDPRSVAWKQVEQTILQLMA